MRIGRSGGIQKCPVCMRKKKEAIDEQVKINKPCDMTNCPFQNEMSRAIQAERNKPKFTFGRKISKFTFGRKTN